MEHLSIQINKEVEDLQEDNPDLVNVEELKSLKENSSANGFMNNSFYSANVKFEIKQDDENNCTDSSTQIDTNENNSEKEENMKCDIYQAPGVQRFNCDLCGKSYKRSRDLASHMSAHTGNYKYNCEICGKGFMIQSSLQTHVRSHTKDKPFVCPVCGKGFSQTTSLVTHKAIHSDEYPFECGQCDRKFKIKQGLNQHMSQTHSAEEFQCGICSRFLKTKVTLKLHLKTHGPRVVKKQRTRTYPCVHCGNVYLCWGGLNYHMRQHTKDFLRCHLCDKTYVSQNRLRIHLRTHTGERPFKCEICNQKFISRDTLKNHRAKHDEKVMKSTKKTYQCEPCQQIFQLHSKFKEHLLKHHNESMEFCETEEIFREHVEEHQLANDEEQKEQNELMYSCDQCNKVYKTVCSLKKHMLYHAEMFKCHICDKAVACKKSLNAHLKKVHNGVKPYKCEICSREFAWNSTFKNHKKMHQNGLKTFKCDLCDKELESNAGLYVHEIEIHSIIEENYQCKLCGEKFETRLEMMKHLYVHKKQEEVVENNTQLTETACSESVCEISRADCSAEELEEHVSTHDVKLFKSYLNDHLKNKHTNKPTAVKCKICSKILKTKDSLRGHMLIHQSDRRMHKCDMCDKDIYVAEKHLRLHKKLKHSTENFECKRNEEDFEMDHKMGDHFSGFKKEEELVENHCVDSNKAIQPPETNCSGSICEICRADCSAEGLEVHMSTHDVKPFKCECFMVFLSDSEYKKHLKDDCEVVKSALELVEDFKVENDVKEELDISLNSIKEECDS